MRSIGRFFILGILVSLFSAAFGHPANIPVARAKVAVDGTIELQMRFDVLAFILDESPLTVLDPPMNALLDGPKNELDLQLKEARKRFEQGLVIAGGGQAAAVEGMDFPNAETVHRLANADPKLRLPVMTTVTIRCRLQSGRKSFYSFPKALGPVVLTTEFPYMEPISEQVEPGSWSRSLAVPSQAEVDAVAASIKARTEGEAKVAAKAKPEAQVRKEIQKQYERWTKAYMVHDVTTLLSLLAPDYTLKTAKGAVITRAEYTVMLNIRKQKHDDTTRYKQEILRITLHDGVAAIWSRETTTSPLKDGKTATFQHDYIDVWTFSKGQWLLQSSATQQEQAVPPTPTGLVVYPAAANILLRYSASANEGVPALSGD